MYDGSDLNHSCITFVKVEFDSRKSSNFCFLRLFVKCKDKCILYIFVLDVVYTMLK